MVGGGEGAFIGAVHRSAASLDGDLELVCGAFSSDAGRSRRAGASLHLDPARCYADYLSDKPATVSLAECKKLKSEIEKSGLLYGLTHPYTSYPLVVEARQRVAAGQLGTIRKVIVEYTQGWLADAVERTGNVQAAWRLDPSKAGPSGCFGDIGVHAFNLVEFVTGLRVTELSADLNRIVDGRALDDDGVALLRFDNDALRIAARGYSVTMNVLIGSASPQILPVPDNPQPSE
jgi:predicted dehydrogenase